MVHLCYSVASVCRLSVWDVIVAKRCVLYRPVRRLVHRSQAKTGSLWARRQTSTRCTSKSDPTNLHQVEGWWAAFTGVETRLWLTVDHLDPPDLPRHGCNSDRGPAPAASGGPSVLANDRNGGRLRLNALRHDDDDINYGTFQHNTFTNGVFMCGFCLI